MPRKYIPKPDPLVDVPPEPSEAELDAIAARRPPPTLVELRSFERSVRVQRLDILAGSNVTHVQAGPDEVGSCT